jgi:hypothetical protein
MEMRTDTAQLKGSFLGLDANRNCWNQGYDLRQFYP